MISSGLAKDIRRRLGHNWKLLCFILLPILLSPIAWGLSNVRPGDDPNKVGVPFQPCISTWNIAPPGKFNCFVVFFAEI